MAETDIILDPIDFITIDTIGPKGKRVFHLQAGKGSQLVTFIIEKEQARALSEAVTDLLDDVDERRGETTDVNFLSYDMELREPINPLFRIAQMGLSFDESRNMILLVAQELVLSDDEFEEPGVVRMWGTREQMRALCHQAMEMVKSGRPDPKLNGKLINYWT